VIDWKAGKRFVMKKKRSHGNHSVQQLGSLADRIDSPDLSDGGVRASTVTPKPNLTQNKI
jgi:hypothetical protein